VEEVAEFLRRIPEASSKNVLVIAMTNLIDTIDPAVLRRGRFDHIIEVQMPTKEEVESLLRHLLKDLPTSADIDFEGISAQLKGHAMSDVTFVVKEAGRLAVKGNKDEIDSDLIYAAVDALPKKKENMRKIGF
jgi:ATP-dependent 26S proteasome regulatory subunit